VRDLRVCSGAVMALKTMRGGGFRIDSCLLRLLGTGQFGIEKGDPMMETCPIITRVICGLVQNLASFRENQGHFFFYQFSMRPKIPLILLFSFVVVCVADFLREIVHK